MFERKITALCNGFTDENRNINSYVMLGNRVKTAT